MKLPELKIGELVSKLPIIQGGMGVRYISFKFSRCCS